MTELLEQKANMWNITTALKKKITLFWIELSVPTAGQKAMSVGFFYRCPFPHLDFLGQTFCWRNWSQVKEFQLLEFCGWCQKKTDGIFWGVKENDWKLEVGEV